MSTSQILLVLLQLGVIGVGGVAALIGGWALASGRTPGWVWLARMPVDHYVRWWGMAALLFGAGAIIETLTWLLGFRLGEGPAVGFGLQLIGVGIWLYIRSKAGFSEG